MIEYLYVICSFATFFGIVIAWFSFYKDFSKLKIMQKISLIIITLGSVIPIILGTIQGMSK